MIPAAVFRTIADAGHHADDPGLDVAADLTLARDGREIRVESYTRRAFVTLPSVGVAVSVFRRHRGWLSALAGVLSTAGLTVVVRIGGIDVAILGTDAEPGRLGRVVGKSVELRVMALGLALADDLA